MEKPDDYTVSFATDGTVSIVSDCNRARGSYTLDDSGDAAITIGPATLALCPDGSRSEEFLRHLTNVVRLSFDGGSLTAVVEPGDDVSAIAFDPVK